MDESSIKNWIKIKETFEKSGNINNMYYKRACEIIKGHKDPLDMLFNSKKYGNQDL
jgi:hypothetical protein